MDVSVPEEEDVPATAYVAVMRELAFDDVEGGIPGFFSLFEELASRPEGNTKPKLRKLAKETQELANGQLPVALESSIVVRLDSERPDKMRAMITGPFDTPYAAGCFVFDIYFPGDYPQKPMMVQFDTTGGGRIRFNPNLYADGKVCLSLLGTWHGSAAEEKWNPKQSTLFQVLVSIQAMILVDEPMYNEPGFEGIRGTPEGNAKSKAYNEEIRLHTMRWAMLAHLRKPRGGLEAPIKEHFRLQRSRILRQCTGWVAQAEDPTRKARMQDALAEIRAALSAL